MTSFAATAALGQVSVFASGDADRWLAALSQLRQDAVAVEAIAVTDLASVEEMLCECLDTTSHRVDAWATSLATARLRATRAQSPQGLHTGAFGWVTDLEPTSPGQRAARDGYIVTPSLQHAATATVLRSGCLAHSDPKAFAVNLTSARVRRGAARPRWHPRAATGVPAGLPIRAWPARSRPGRVHPRVPGALSDRPGRRPERGRRPPRHKPRSAPATSSTGWRSAPTRRRTMPAPRRRGRLRPGRDPGIGGRTR